MVKPDDILLSRARSEKARASDKLAEQLVSQRQRVFALTFWLLLIAEAAFWYFDLALWVRIVLPLIWLGFLLHNNALLILHELWEINDQLSGRKDDLRRLVSRQEDEPERE